MIEIITTETQFSELEMEWNSLYDRAEIKTPFQSFVFSWSSWNNFLKMKKENKLWIVCYKRHTNESVSAILPLYIDKRGVLRFLNDLHLDFGDGLFEKNDLIYFFSKSVVEAILKENKIKGAILSNFTNKSSLFPYLKNLLPQSLVYSTSEHSFLPVIEQNEIEKSSHLRSKEKSELRKAQKLNSDLKHQTYSIQKQPFPLNELVEIRNKMIANGVRDSSFFGDEFINLCRDLYNKNLMVISVTNSESGISSASTIMHDASSQWYMFWISMYDDKRPLINIFNNNCFINSCLVDKKNCIDFGRGGYDYKFRNYLPIVQNVYELIWGKTLITTMRMFFRINFFYLKRILKPIFRKK